MNRIIKAKHIEMVLFSVQDFFARRGVGFRYLVAVVAIAAMSAGVHMALQPILDSRLAYMTLFPAVMLIALFEGLGPGLLATALSGLMVIFWHEPLGHQFNYDFASWLVLAVFCASCTMLSVIYEALRRAQTQAMEADTNAKLNDERLHGEQALSASKEHIRYILKYNPTAIAVLDRQMRYLMVSDRFLKDYRLTEEDVIGKSHYEIFPEIPEPWRQVHQQCLAGKVERREDDPFPRTDGSVDYVCWECRPWKDSQGRVGGIIIYTEVITERKLAEAALRESEEKFRLMAECANAVVGIVQGKRFVYANPFFERLSGYSLEEILAREFVDFVHPDFREQIAKNAYNRQMGLPAPDHYEFKMVTCQSEERWIDISLGRIEYRHRPAIIGIGFDITDRKRAEEEARQQREWLQVTLSSIGDGVITCDMQAKVTFLNPVAQRLTGWELMEAQGQPIPSVFKVVNELTRQPAGDIVGRVMSENNVVRLSNHTVMVTRDGREIPIEDSAAPILDSEGNVSGVVLVFHDVTQRRRAHEALVEREERLNLALESGQMGLWEWDVRTNRSVWNAREYELLGLPVGDREVQTELFFRYVHPEDTPDLGHTLSQVLREGRDWGHEFRIIRADNGQGRWIAAAGRVFRDSQGHPLRMIGVNYDITERKQREAELERINNRLRDADRRKDEFLAMLAHELRNPLAPIRNAVHVIGMVGTSEPRMLRQREIIDRQVAHMAHLLDDLLDVSRITRGMVNLKRQPLNLWDVLHRAVETVNPLIESRHHELTVAPPAEELWVSGDFDRLIQVVGNMLNNAAKYTEPGGHIWLSAKCEGAKAVIQVRDTGVGITQELLPQVFDIFTQAERTLDRSQGGLGLGLTLVRRLVQMHGGTVEAHSAGIGHGSEFIVRLPLLVAEETTGSSAQSPVQASKAVHRILVVDDVIDTANSLAELLSLLGHLVRTAYDGQGALTIAREFRPDVILLDIGLPGLDGFEVASRIRREPALEGVLLLAVTGYDKDEDRQKAERSGFDRLLTKPLDLNALQTLLT